VGVDLQQDGDAVAGLAGDLGRRHPGVLPERHCRVPQVINAAISSSFGFGGQNAALLFTRQ
jgi:hypothetical protein